MSLYDTIDAQSFFRHHGVIFHTKQRGFSEIYPLLWCLAQAVRIRFHSEHMGSLTCVHLCLQHIHMCVSLFLYVCMCVCVWLSAERVELPLPLTANGAETSAYVAEFIRVNSRVWNACFPHWAEHFLMQYVNTCHDSVQRAEILRGRWATGYRTGLRWRGRDGGRQFCDSINSLKIYFGFLLNLRQINWSYSFISEENEQIQPHLIVFI